MNKEPYRIGVKDIRRERLEILQKSKRYMRKHGKRKEPKEMNHLDRIERMHGANSLHEYGIARNRRKKKTGNKKTGNEVRKKVAAFFEMLTAGTSSREDPAEQHVTTATELTADILILRERYTGPDGLDAKRYCSALNSWRDNILFTAGELKKAVEDACRSGDAAAVPGYKVLINQCQTNAGLLAKEIESVGGTVNK